jgi:TolB-like protein/tetratricopeptide (TPR) repeat protein
VTAELKDQLANALGESYRVVRELTAGGMARVFVARDLTLGRDIVVKALSAELTASISIDRFRREILIAAQLRHPRIVPVISAGQSQDLFYYTMPLIEGASLRALLDAEGQLACDLAVRYAVDVAEALQYAHGQNIVHRDIKPDNILIDGEHALVTDFGIARAIEHASQLNSVTSTGITLGTPTYMSPEQAAADRELDGRSDIYSLGCVLYEMLAGEPPFTGNARAVLARHIQERPPSLRIVRPDLPEHVADSVARALSKVPADRFASAADFAAALQGRVPATPPRGGKRHPRIRTRYVVAALVMLAVGTVATIWRRENAHASAGTPASSGAFDPRTIAILYLDAPPGDATLTALAHGITRDLIARLSEVHGLTLISESGIRRFDHGASADTVAMTLHAGTVVTGSIEPDGDSLRVGVQLIDPTSLTQSASIRVSTIRGRSLALRDTVVSQVAAQLRRVLGDRIELQQWKTATSPRAWELRQQAADLAEPGGAAATRASAIDLRLRAQLADSLLREASRRDPKWAEPVIARGWLASRRAIDDALSVAERDGSLRAGLAIAEDALRLSPGDPRAYELRGYLRFQRWWFVTPRKGEQALADSAERDLLQATRDNPSAARAWSALSVLHQARGDAAGALENARHALRADPFLRDVAPSTQRLIFAHLFAGRGDSARALCSDAVRRFPNDVGLRQCELNVLGWTASGTKDLARATTLLESVEHDSVYARARGIWPPGRYYLAAILARSGRSSEARAVVRAVRDSLRGADASLESPLNEAYVWTLLQQHDSAVAVLTRAVQRQPNLRATIDRYPWFAPLRSDSAYRALIGAR